MKKATKYVRAQLLITPGQKAWLRSRAAKFSLSESELIRRVLDTYISDPDTSPQKEEGHK